MNNKNINSIILDNLKSIENKYKAFILDIWGVLWDGIEPYDTAVSTLSSIKLLKKPVLLLSNAPRRSIVVKNKLTNIGINNKYYDKIISSGEVCRQKFLKNRNILSQVGNSYYFIGQEDDEKIVENLNLERVRNISKANFLLVCGTRDFSDKIENYEEELNLGLKYNIPFVCANPDKVVIRKNGDLLICAGKLAEYYSYYGGKVYNYGKPYHTVYGLCLNYLKNIDSDISKKDILVIGDSLETDILGANSFGLDSLLIAEGIHSGDLFDSNKRLSLNNIENLSAKFNAYPSFVMNKFSF